MSREIKFRGWDKYDKKMIYDLCQVDSFWHYYSYSDNTGLHFGKTGPNGVGEDFENKYIMQYTGLKDKNGKEIYEGDIVKCRVNDNSIKGEEAYVLDKDGFGLEHIKKTVNYKIEFWNSNYNYGYRVKNGKTNFMITQGTLLNIEAEVIGNIYENSELLEEKQ